MEQKKIHPYLIDEKRLAGYYELLLEDGFELRIFDKKKDKELDTYFLPVVKEYLFWTFNLKNKEDVCEYKGMSNDLKAAVCSRYPCNVFIKKDDTVICFNTGVCFAITDNDKILKKITRYEQNQKMQEINLREEDYYEFRAEDFQSSVQSHSVQEGHKGEIDQKEQESYNSEIAQNKQEEAHQYIYILQLYKMIFLQKLNKEIQEPVLFDKARSEFTRFTQEIYVLKETDKDKYAEKLIEEFKIEELYLLVENQFDLLYKNNKLDEGINTKRLLILLLIVAIIVGIINLFNAIT